MNRKSEGLTFLIAVLVGLAIRLSLTHFGNNADIHILYDIARRPWGTHFYSEIPFWANGGPICY